MKKIQLLGLLCLVFFCMIPVFAQSAEPMFAIANGEVKKYSIDKNEKSLIVEIHAKGEGRVVAFLPRDVIDAKIQEKDDTFSVLVRSSDNNMWKLSEFIETKIENSRVLNIPFTQNVTEIIIVGTQISDNPKNQKHFSWLRPALESNEITVQKQTPYKYYTIPMPKQWESEFGSVIEEATEFWNKKNPNYNFAEVSNQEEADLIIEWGSSSDEFLGYFSCGYESGRCKILVNLGYSDSGNWKLASKEYANVIMTHEFGHFLGFEHVQDPNDIMYPAIESYERWLALKNTQNKESEPQRNGLDSKDEIPDWVRNLTKSWANNQIGDDRFQDGIEFLIKKGIINTPEVEKSDSDSKEIPLWIKNNASWWTKGEIDDNTFLQGIQYLINKGVFKVGI